MSAIVRLRLRLGVWLLKPHWLPLLERCTYISIGIKHAIGVTGWWPK